MKRTIKQIDDELDQLQMAYINEEDDRRQTSIVRKFTALLDEATEADGKLRNAAGVTIHNWTRD